MADALINAGASVSLRDQYGDTPLHYAAFCGSTDVAKKLLAAGADVNSISADGRTALSIAKDESRVDIVNLIMDAATSNSLSTFSSAKEAELTAIGKGAADSAAVFAGGSDGKAGKGITSLEAAGNAYTLGVTALSDAAFLGDVRSISALLKSGADVNGADQDGITPLHRAATSRSVLAVGLLLGHGADPNARDVAGCTPLHYSSFCGLTDISHMLLSAGGDPLRRNRDRLTPIDVAKAEGREGVVKLLTGAYTKVENLDFSHGVVLEGTLKAKREGNSIGVMLFRWKSKHVVLSRFYRALFAWNGGPTTVDGPVTRIKLDNIATVTHDAKSASINFIIKPVRGDTLEFMAGSAEDAAAWCSAIKELMVSSVEDENKAIYVQQIITHSNFGIPLTAAVSDPIPASVPDAPEGSADAVEGEGKKKKKKKAKAADGEAAVEEVVAQVVTTPLAAEALAAATATVEAAAQHVSFTSGSPPAAVELKTKLKVSSVTAAGVATAAAAAAGTEAQPTKTKKKKASAEVNAAIFLQRIWKGFKARKMTRGWTKVIDGEDVYYFNTKTQESLWVAPWFDTPESAS